MTRGMLRSGSLVAAAVLVGLLAACSTTASSRPTPPAPSRSASAHPATITEPASQIPGDCTDFVSAGQATAVGGAFTVPSSPIDIAAAVLAEQQQAGQVSCSWDFAAPQDRQEAMDLLIRRHAADIVATFPNKDVGFPGGATAEIGADRSSLVCSEFGGRQTCQIAFVVGDYVVTAHVDSDQDKGTLDRLQTAFVAAMTATTARLRSQPVPAAWTRPASARAFDVDCAAVATESGLAAALGWAGALAGDADNSPADISLGGGRECLWLPPGPSPSALPQLVVVDMVSGGAWIWPRFSTQQGARTITVAGADHAAVLCDGSPGSCQVTATIGSDVVTFTQSSALGTGTGPELAAGLAKAAAAVLPVLVEGS